MAMIQENKTNNHKSDDKNTEMSNMLLSRNVAKERNCYDLDEVVRAWFNNKMMILLMRMQYIKAPDSLGMMKSVFFLDEIEHHFISTKASKSIRNAFRYLRRYISVYPYVTKTHCERACEMIARVYQAMGYKFNYAPSFNGFHDEIGKTGRRSMEHNPTKEIQK